MELVPLVSLCLLSLGASLVLCIAGKTGRFPVSWFVQYVILSSSHHWPLSSLRLCLQAGLSSKATPTFEHATKFDHQP